MALDYANSNKPAPATAEECLHSLCDPARLAVTRRWAGLALRDMVSSSNATSTHLVMLPHALLRLGPVIHRSTELEETKIVAGIVMRELLAKGTSFEEFWPPGKAPCSATPFPQEDGRNWMGSFQTYLDATDKLTATDAATQPVILYPISLTGSGGFKWRDGEPVHSIAIIQNNGLTIIAPDVTMQTITFVDVPLAHVERMSTQKASLHDSQAREVEYEPWELVLSLKPGLWTYRVGTAAYNGTELTVLFAHRGDVEVCQKSIEKLQACAHADLPKTSSSRVILDIGSNNDDEGKILSPGQANGTKREAPQELSDTIREENTNLGTKLHYMNDHSDSDESDRVLSFRNSVQVEPSSNDIVPVSDAVDSSGRRLEAIVAPIVKRPQRNFGTGALPKIRKIKRLDRCTKIGNDHDTRDEFTFPTESPRMKRPTKMSTPLSLPNTTTVAQKEGTPCLPKSTGPQILSNTKRTTNQSSDNGVSEDPFAIPHDEDPKIMAPGDTKVSHAVISKNFKYMKHGGNGSNPTPETNKGLGAARREAPRSAERTSAEKDRQGPESQKESMKAKSKGHEPRISPQRHAVLASLLSSAESVQLQESEINFEQPKTENTTTTRNPIYGTVGMLDEGCSALYSVSHHPGSTIGNSSLSTPDDKEIKEGNLSAKNAWMAMDRGELVNKLGDEVIDMENNSDPGVDATMTLEVETEELSTALSRKRTVETPPPLTLRVTRIKKNASSIGDDAWHAAGLSLPEPFGPSRITNDASSPCAVTRGVRIASASFANDWDNLDLQPVGRDPRILHKATELEGKLVTGKETFPGYEHRTNSSRFVNLERFSSNSKPLPAPPQAPSKAIYGHADSIDVEFDPAFEPHNASKDNPNPFMHRPSRQRHTVFVQRLTGESADCTVRAGSEHDLQLNHAAEAGTPCTEGIENGFCENKQMLVALSPSRTDEQVNSAIAALDGPTAQSGTRVSNYVMNRQGESEADFSRHTIQSDKTHKSHDYHEKEMGMEGDTTVVADVEEQSASGTTSLVHQSSPLVRRRSQSSHSSTSEEKEERPQLAMTTMVMTEEAEDILWEQSLRPHQRVVGEKLVRVSRHVLRYIIRGELAVEDIAVTYSTDGHRLLQTVQEQSNGYVQATFKKINTKKATMRSAFSGVLKIVKKERDPSSIGPVQAALACDSDKKSWISSVGQSE